LKQIFLKLGIALFLCISMFSCKTEPQKVVTRISNPLDRLPNNQAGEIVKKAITKAGGWETWSSKKNFTFYKNITQLDSTGQEIRKIRQLHQYRLKPNFGARMTWEKDGKKYTIINNGQQAWKYENGKELTDDNSKKEAWNSSFGSNYVASMPFKLTDPGTILSYDGLDTLENQTIVHALKVAYEKGAGSSGGFHTWWYYLDKDSYDLVANYLDSGKSQSYTSYKIFTNIDNIRIHELRHSHASDATKAIGRIKTIYGNEEMQFDMPMENDLFEPIVQ